jgi:hypothetical protein
METERDETAGPVIAPEHNDLLQSLARSDPSSESTPASKAAATKAPARNGGGDDDDFAALLKAYEPAKDGNGKTEPAAAAPAQKSAVLSDDDLLLLAMRQDQQQVFMRRMIERDFVEARARQERVDFDEVLGVAAERLEGLKHLPANYAERHLLAEYTINKEFAAAWDHRYDNEQACEHARKVTERVLKSLEKAARDVPRPEDLLATEDREAVAAAVRGASARVPERKLPNFNLMSDAEYLRERKQLFGF